MGGCAGKKSVERLVVPWKPSGLSLRENMNKKDDKKVHVSSRVGCSSGQASSTKGIRIGLKDNSAKVVKPPVSSSSNGKEVVGSSSRTPGLGCVRKPAIVNTKRPLSSNLDIDSSETSSTHVDPAALESTLQSLKPKRRTISVNLQRPVPKEAVVTKAGSSSGGASRNSHQKSDSGTKDDALTGPSVTSSSDNRESTVRGGLSINRFKNLKCKSVSDVLPTSSSSTTRIPMAKKKNSVGESSSSSKGIKTSMSVVKGRNQTSTNGNNTTVSDTRRNRVIPTIRENSVVSSSGRRPVRLGSVTSSSTSQRGLHPETPTNPNPSPSNSYMRQNSSSGRLRSTMPSSPSEAETPRCLVNREGLSLYNMNGIAEVLLALNRIDHGEELIQEQLASLESNLFSSGMLRFYDQHRDMRLDIDNMSYEELLALGDEIGTVSTALSEEALSRCLTKSIYKETNETTLKKEDDIKCSICQEEYVDEDEVGTMPCQHMYHVSCVEQWLRMKNWCPICKTSPEQEKSF